MNKILPILVAAIGIIGAGAWYWSSQQADIPVGSTLLEQAGDDTAVGADGVDTSGVIEMTLGADDAPVSIIEYASYTCPHCANFHEGTFKDLKADYIDTGKVKFTYREVYFDRPGIWASMIARCGGAEKFFGITDLIYKGQSTWARASDPGAIANELRKIGRIAGLGEEELEACLMDGEKAQALVAWFEANRAADGISSTPSFVIDGKLYSNMSYAEFQSIINEKIDG